MNLNKKIKLEEGIYSEEVQSDDHEEYQLKHFATRIKSEIEAFDYDDLVSSTIIQHIRHLENGNIKLETTPIEEITIEESKDVDQSAVYDENGEVKSVAEIKQEIDDPSIDDLQSHHGDNMFIIADDRESSEEIQIKDEITIEETQIEEYSEFELSSQKSRYDSPKDKSSRKDNHQDSKQKVENQNKQKGAIKNTKSKKVQKFCKFCDFSCDTKTMLLEHNKTIHPNDCIFKCNSCYSDFRGKSELEKHIADEHQGLGSKCYICLAQYKKGHWKEHEVQCLGRLIFSCKTCEMRFVKQEGIFKHLEEHGALKDRKESLISELRIMEPISSCKICDDGKAYSKDAYHNHVQEDHGGCKLSCPRCKKLFKYYSGRSTHMSKNCKIGLNPKLDTNTPMASHQVHNSVQKFENQESANQLNRYDNFDVHIEQPDLSDRSTSNNIWTESGVDENFQIKQEITIEEPKIQENTNHETSTQKLCKFCDFSCNHPTKLWKHVIKDHPNERTAYCSLCPSSFKGATELEKHIDDKHQGLGNRCRFCTGQYKKGGWEEHVALCPGRKLFICSSCEKCYLTKEGLLKHMDEHGVSESLKESCSTVAVVKEQILCCEICEDDRAFRNDDHRKHVEEEHNGRKLRCTDCRKTFKNYSSRYSHIKKSCRIGLFRKRSAAKETLHEADN